jgi:hypothetical protein
MSNYWNRREFLKKTSSAAFAAMAAGMPTSLLNSCSAPTIPAKADTVILLWMAGGMAHTDTFDPKKYTPYEKGMQANSVLSTFKSLPTALDGIHFSEGLQSIGNVTE